MLNTIHFFIHSSNVVVVCFVLFSYPSFCEKSVFSGWNECEKKIVKISQRLFGVECVSHYSRKLVTITKQMQNFCDENGMKKINLLCLPSYFSSSISSLFVLCVYFFGWKLSTYFCFWEQQQWELKEVGEEKCNNERRARVWEIYFIQQTEENTVAKKKRSNSNNT